MHSGLDFRSDDGQPKGAQRPQVLADGTRWWEFTKEPKRRITDYEFSGATRPSCRAEPQVADARTRHRLTKSHGWRPLQRGVRRPAFDASTTLLHPQTWVVGYEPFWGDGQGGLEAAA